MYTICLSLTLFLMDREKNNFANYTRKLYLLHTQNRQKMHNNLQINQFEHFSYINK